MLLIYSTLIFLLVFSYLLSWFFGRGPAVPCQSREQILEQEVARLQKENERLSIEANKTEYR